MEARDPETSTKLTFWFRHRKWLGKQEQISHRSSKDLICYSIFITGATTGTATEQDIALCERRVLNLSD